MISVPGKVRSSTPSGSRVPSRKTAALAAALAAAICLSVSPGQTETATGARFPIQQKVLPPIEVFLEPSSRIIPGEIARFRVAVIPRVAPKEIRITCRPSPGIEWVAGDTVTVRTGALGRRDELDLAVRVPTSGFRALHVIIELVTEDGTVWRRGVGTRLGPDDLSKTARSVRAADGARSFLEYPAAPARRGR